MQWKIWVTVLIYELKTMVPLFQKLKKNNVFLECTRLFASLCEFYAQYCTGKENLFNDQELL